MYLRNKNIFIVAKHLFLYSVFQEGALLLSKRLQHLPDFRDSVADFDECTFSLHMALKSDNHTK